MGNCWARVFRRRRTRRHIVLILIGLDNAGKTKTVNNLAGESDDLVLPTVGFKAVNLAHKDTPVTIYDLGGGPHFRQIWPQYYSEIHGVIFVIDSSDYSRLDECKEVLEEVLSHGKISGKPVLILANKQDKTGALDDIDVVEKLSIEPLVNKYRCPTLVESYTAQQLYTKSKKPKIDPGLRKGYHWLLNYIDRRYGDINLRVQTDIHADLERRKRMMSKLSNRASQTFTAVSDDIATQTGFENPNYEFNKRTIDREQDMENGIILVKPITPNVNPNSGDTTITFESVDTDSSNAKPKLSPLFGRENSSVLDQSETVQVELEPRAEFRKLSPLMRSRNTGQHIDFKNRPQSSPSAKKQKKKAPQHPPSNSSSIKEEDQKTDTSGCPVSDGCRSWDASLVTRRPDEQREVLSERAVKPSTNTLGTQSCPLTLPARPASASLLLRRQLEANTQKRRHSLRFVNRNKTSPERATMLIYTPVKAPHRRDTGDFEQTAAIN